FGKLGLQVVPLPEKPPTARQEKDGERGDYDRDDRQDADFQFRPGERTRTRHNGGSLKLSALGFQLSARLQPSNARAESRQPRAYRLMREMFSGTRLSTPSAQSRRPRSRSGRRAA